MKTNPNLFLLSHRYSNMLSILFFFFGLTWGNYAADLSFFYTSDSATAAADQTRTTTIYSASILLDVNKKERFFIGWNYLSFGTAEAGLVEDTFAQTSMGPSFMYIPTKSKNWSIEFSYHLIMSASTSSVSGSQWTGTSMLGSVGYMPEMNEGLRVGLKLNYLGSTYAKETIATTVNDISYTRSYIYPSISIQLR